MIFVAHLVTHFANIDLRNKTKLHQFVTQDRTVIDKIIKEEKKDPTKGFALKLASILKHVLGNKNAKVIDPD